MSPVRIAAVDTENAHVIGFLTLLPQPLCTKDDGAALHPPQRRRGADRVLGLRKLEPASVGKGRRGNRAPGAGAGDPEPGTRKQHRHRARLGRSVLTPSPTPPPCRNGRQRIDRSGHRLRDQTAPPASPATPPLASPLTTRSQALPASLRNRRTDRLRSHHGGPRHHPELALELRASVEKAARYYETLGYGSFASGNADGGLTTIEEKSPGAYMKSANRQSPAPDQTWRHSPQGRALPDGRGSRTAALWLSRFPTMPRLSR